MSDRISRRELLGASALAAVGTAVGAAPALAASAPSWLPATWDDEADVLIVGCGAAGLCAAIQAKLDGAEDVLVLEAAPEHHAGGSTRVSGGLVFMPNDVESALAYQGALNGPYKVDDDIMDAWAHGVGGNKAWLNEEIGLPMLPSGFSSPEFPGLPGSEGAVSYTVDGGVAGAGLWQPLFDKASQLGARFAYDARATELVFEPETREVYGVRLEDGRAVKGRKGTVLALGGFTNNQDMVQDYFCGGGASKILAIGSPYNRGDGVVMAQQVGARLWHMNNYSGNGVAVLGADDWTNNATSFSSPAKDWIYVGPDGKRFMYEESNGLNRHGRISDRGAWPVLSVPTTSWMVFGSDCFGAEEMSFNKITYMVWTGYMGTLTATSNQEMVDQGLVKKADTLEELAALTGLPADELVRTVTAYNENAAAGVDPEFGRGEALYSNYFFNPDAGTTGSAEEAADEIVAVEPFELQELKAPFYAIEIRAAFMNTQGGRQAQRPEPGARLQGRTHRAPVFRRRVRCRLPVHVQRRRQHLRRHLLGPRGRRPGGSAGAVGVGGPFTTAGPLPRAS